ncbi:REP-associated tyrosine transposase [Dethiosulfatarculus sandiegensis]|uniref:Transposase IS200-like domain-containing protein n=1 Tax=Dethiosulfatarculus sandiegensis TaxID=1429043 RepID=A0A0D2HY88_9BACT|nr:transposase [Dethiosulfatarculus sandiegensis]KIX15283.1 hypothetical protein X474_03720 [Dethiosulfatarculus sandiegensis]
MPRPLRASKGGVVYHVINRANARTTIFENESDYQALEKVIGEAHERRPIRIIDYCIMPNHWHMVLWPEQDGDLSAFLGWLTMTHTQRWHANHGTTGSGHLYQGRFKSFPVQTDRHYYTVGRYVVRNPVRAGLVDRAEKWPWSSVGLKQSVNSKTAGLLSDGPLERPIEWLEFVNQPETDSDLASLRESIQRGRPFGEMDWLKRVVKDFGMESTLGPRGRPRKSVN